MQQPPLFDGPPASISLQANYDVPDGWRLRVVMRREGEVWSDAYTVDYSHLSTSEVIDVISVEASIRLSDA